jgi:hypothetical protein
MELPYLDMARKFVKLDSPRCDNPDGHLFVYTGNYESYDGVTGYPEIWCPRCDFRKYRGRAIPIGDVPREGTRVTK